MWAHDWHKSIEDSSILHNCVKNKTLIVYLDKPTKNVLLHKLVSHSDNSKHKHNGIL